MRLWIAAIVAVARRLLELVRWEREAIARRRDLEAAIAYEQRHATWICPLHGDAWRRREGGIVTLHGGWILPLSTADAEDFHGYVRAPGEASW